MEAKAKAKTNVKPLIIDDGTRKIRIAEGMVKNKISIANQAVEKFNHDYRKVVTLTNDEIRVIAQGDLKEAIGGILDRVYPSTPPEYRESYVNEVRAALIAIENKLNVRNVNGMYSHFINGDKCIEVVNGKYTKSKDCDKYLSELFVQYIATPQRIKEYKAVQDACKVLSDAKKRLGYRYGYFSDFLEIDDQSDSITPIALEFSENPHY